MKVASAVQPAKPLSSVRSAAESVMNTSIKWFYFFSITLVSLMLVGCGQQQPQSPKLTNDVAQKLGREKAKLQQYEEALGPGVKVQNPEGRDPRVQAYRWVRWTNGSLTLTVGTTEQGDVLQAYVIDMSK
jgi:hypothetical protein